MRRYRVDDKIISEINITPLTDVALVLLIIFMVTTPMILAGGINVKLPSATAADTTPQRNITISITLDNKVYLNDRETGFDGLQPALEQFLKNEKDKTVILNADKNVMHGQVVRVLDIAKKAGAVKLAIAAERAGDK
ncbi:MAG: biopolymer transporter ExbD [Candidatus Firestonebacteria bacterium]|nr:biopolymer transporter ExbD [Candidatus Firestonebacteria bacterium]